MPGGCLRGAGTRLLERMSDLRSDDRRHLGVRRECQRSLHPYLLSKAMPNLVWNRGVPGTVVDEACIHGEEIEMVR